MVKSFYGQGFAYTWFGEKREGKQVGVVARVGVEVGRRPSPSYIEGVAARVAPSPSL
jgi:hypothetical protein